VLKIEEYINIISQVGFPMFVACFFMFETNKQEKRTQEILIELKLAIEGMKK